jgi:hypothetical protein
MPLELAAELKLRICHTALFITDGQGSSNEKKQPRKEVRMQHTHTHLFAETSGINP